MIRLCLSMIILFIINTTYSQSSYTYGELKIGYGITSFGDGLSDRYEEGNFSTSGGSLTTLSVYRKFEFTDYLNFGLKFKGLGAMPSSNEVGEEMFFNFWSVAISTKYFPFAAENNTIPTGIYLNADYNFITQFTQKYRNTETLDFDHQFAIGSSFTVGAGYHYDLGNRYGLVASVEYDLASRTGEVQDIGDVTFQNDNISFQIGLTF